MQLGELALELAYLLRQRPWAFDLTKDELVGVDAKCAGDRADGLGRRLSFTAGLFEPVHGFDANPGLVGDFILGHPTKLTQLGDRITKLLRVERHTAIFHNQSTNVYGINK